MIDFNIIQFKCEQYIYIIDKNYIYPLNFNKYMDATRYAIKHSNILKCCEQSEKPFLEQLNDIYMKRVAELQTA